MIDKEIMHPDDAKFNQEILKNKCNHCPYTSANKSKFKNHVKAVHEKIKDYACDDCSYTTTLKEYLKKHRVNVHQKIM